MIVLRCNHFNQMDYAVLLPFESSLSMKSLPSTRVNELYLLNSQLWLSFLARLDAKDTYFKPETVFEKVCSMEKEWLNFDIRLET